MNSSLYILAIIIVVSLAVLSGVIIFINKSINRYNKKEAEEILDILIKSVDESLTEAVREYIGKIEVTNYDINNPAQQYRLIEDDILDFAFNRANKMITELLKDRLPDQKSKIYDLILKMITPEKIEDLVKRVFDLDDIKDSITEIYNQCFGKSIEDIEEKDAELQNEMLQYEEAAAIKDETVEQHDQSIEEYAKSHLQEKIDEVNKVYDDTEKKSSNVVPVRDLRELKVLSYDEEINPPKDDPEETLEDDGTFEVLEYIEDKE